MAAATRRCARRRSVFYPKVDSDKYIVGLPAQTNTYSCPTSGCGSLPEANLTGRIEYLYDNVSDYTAIPTAGKLTGERRLLRFAGSNTTDPRYTDINYGYDAWGNRTSVTQYTPMRARRRARRKPRKPPRLRSTRSTIPTRPNRPTRPTTSHAGW